MTEGLDLPTYEDVEEAADIIKGVANRTPMQTSRFLDSQLGVNVFIKCENFQRIGAFKFRGAYNYLSHLSSEVKSKGVITYSSGNHATATALAAKKLGIDATIIIPEDAPKLKIEASKAAGGNVVIYDRYNKKREDVAAEIQAKTGGHVFHHHKYVLAGQGTAGKELMEEVLERGDGPLDYLIIGIGSGGLISGCAIVAEKLAPGCKVIGVEPEVGNNTQQSLEKGEIVRIETPKTIADGAQTQQIGKLTFEIMSKKVEKIITVTDEQLIDELRFLGERMKLVVEPTGCLGLAGLRKMVASGEVPPNSKCGVIVSGGNVDMRKYFELIG
mmetsp:Transcript_2289/g.3211  ORF Transcript_2289/g.3211 Transcript_2289/m.3211 type:complete len:329 (-) Transcript_2289:191-1177(-)